MPDHIAAHHPLPHPVLPPALAADQIKWVTRAGMVCGYRAGPDLKPDTGATPLLLIHSINAVASAAEVAPLFEHFRRDRPVYALDLPGFGASDRSARRYTPRLMVDALAAVIDVIRAEHGGAAVDVLAVSLSCEFAARAQVERPDSIARLVLVSPTGFSRQRRHYGPDGSNRGQAWLYRFFTRPLWSATIYRTLTRPAVIRYFLRRTWGSSRIDEGLWRYGVITSRQPGACHAPFDFVSAYLFSGDINRVYEAVRCPVWVSMATRGDFTDYQGRATLGAHANWQFQAIDGGALPYFEDLSAFVSALKPFWQVAA